MSSSDSDSKTTKPQQNAMLCCPWNHQLSFFFFIQFSFIHSLGRDAPIGISDVN